MKLIIFDLDQTLVDFLPGHAETVRRLFLREFNIDAKLTGIDFSGRSLTDNIAELARANGIDADSVRVRMAELLAEYEQIFFSLMPPDLSGYVLPGVRQLLQRLTKDGHVIVLYTGDSPAIARKVLSSAGLDGYFRFEVYGTEAETRPDMAKLAVRKASEITGTKFSGKQVVIIGDALRDVDCARQLKALSVAVATGVHSIDDLRNAGADYAFKDLADTESVVQAIESCHSDNVPLKTG
ncbi:MAG: HAD family hydrolase [Dehalococcoidia bacterium]|jgi:phosphoglycolate phosphatase-like HAD superfamily hydrolase